MITILSIDDDAVVRKHLCRVLDGEYQTILSNNGEDGIAKAVMKKPDIILLDVEMPDRNGYEVCEYLRNHEATKNIPIVFLSSRGDLSERMRGYEVGATDYMVKPFQKDDLLARLRVLTKFRDREIKLHEKVKDAEKAAHIAMTGSSELGVVMKFVETSIELTSYESLGELMFQVLESLGLNSALRILTPEGELYFSSNGNISPLERQLIDQLKDRARFQDFDCRTQINYPYVSVLIKNMPLDDMERYGRLKDVLPAVLSAADAKVRSINAEKVIRAQALEVSQAFSMVQSQLLAIANGLQGNQVKSQGILRGMLSELTHELPRMGLEDDQEEAILRSIEKAINDSFDVLEDGDSIKKTLSEASEQLHDIIDRQNRLMEDLLSQRKRSGPDDEQELMSVELF